MSANIFALHDGDPAASLVRDLARRAAGMEVALDGGSIDAEAFSDVVSTAHVHGLVPQLCDAVAQGDVAVDHDAAERLDELRRWTVRRVLQLEQHLLAVAGLLTSQSVAFRVLKGPALARTVVPTGQFRTFMDLDVLVRSEDVDQTVDVLAGAGYGRELPQLRPGFDRTFAKTVTCVARDGCEVDLHRTLVVGPLGLLVELDDLFATARAIDVGGTSLPALGADEQLLNVCYHAVLGDVPPRLRSLVDVAQSLSDSGLHTDRVLRIASRWSGLAVVARALRLVDATLGTRTHPLASWAQAYRPSRSERRLLRCYVSDKRSNARKYLRSLQVIDGVAPKTRYLAALLAPQHTFIAGQHAGYGRRVITAAVDAVGGFRWHRGDIRDA